MNCLCNCCKYFFRVTSITVNSTDVTLTTDRTSTLENLQPFCFAITTDLPSGISALPVKIAVGTATINLLDRAGNPVLGSELIKRRKIKGYYGSTGPQIVAYTLPPQCNCKCGK